MTELNKYFKDHAGEFDDFELPEGCEARFEKLLEAEDKRKILYQKRLKWMLATCAAAVAALLLVLNIPSSGSRDWFASVGDDPVEVYMTYSQTAAELCREIYSENFDPSVGNAIQSLTQEPLTMLEQLPDAMSDTEKAAILKDYYGKLLNGLTELK